MPRKLGHDTKEWGLAATRPVCLLLLLCAASVSPARAADAGLVPVEAFSRLPMIGGARLSPGGAHLAYLLNEDGQSYLITRSEGSPDTVVVQSDNESVRFHWFRWASDERLLVSGVFPSARYGLETTETRLLSVRRDGTEMKVFAGSEKRARQPQFQDEIVSMLPRDPHHVLIALDDDRPGYPAVHRLDVRTGQRRQVQKARRPIRWWIADQQSRVRLGVGYDDGVVSAHVLDLESRKWREIWRYEVVDEPPIRPMGFGSDPDLLYVRALHEGRNSVFIVDLKDPGLDRTLVAHHPEYDIDGLLIHSPKTGDAVGVYDYGADGNRIYWSDAYKRLQETIDRALPDTTNYLVSISDDERRYIVLSTSDVRPGVFYYGDRETGEFHAFGEMYPELASHTLSGKDPVEYEARDGLKIEGYLTRPWGDPPKPWPAVVLPHGGPGARDYRGFDYVAEFLASRGYAVFQMNFRGSSGYGWDFEQAGFRDFGGKMQDDVTDGARWLMKRGIARPDGICIMGASYGGYAALWGAVKEPELFRCAVSLAGISDLTQVLLRSRHYVTSEAARRQLGKRSDLKEVSPLRHVDAIRIPVLLLHGEEDRVVPVEQSQRMAKALERHGKAYRYVELEGGVHDLSNERNRTGFLLEVERFLAEHLAPPPDATPGGDPEPPGEPPSI